MTLFRGSTRTFFFLNGVSSVTVLDFVSVETIAGNDSTTVYEPGSYRLDGRLTSASFSQVPEPSTFAVWGLLGITVAGGAWWKRRRTAA